MAHTRSFSFEWVCWHQLDQRISHFDTLSVSCRSFKEWQDGVRGAFPAIWPFGLLFNNIAFNYWNCSLLLIGKMHVKKFKSYRVYIYSLCIYIYTYIYFTAETEMLLTGKVRKVNLKFPIFKIICFSYVFIFIQRVILSIFVGQGISCLPLNC